MAAWRKLQTPSSKSRSLHEPGLGAPASSPARRRRSQRLPGRFMVPMHGRAAEGALHEPTHPRPLPGGEQEFVWVLLVPLLGGVRGGFMVPMHAQKRMAATHEPIFTNPND